MTEPTIPNPAPLVMTKRDVAAMLKMSERTVTTLVSSGAIPSVKILRSRRFIAADVIAALRNLKPEAAASACGAGQ